MQGMILPANGSQAEQRRAAPEEACATAAMHCIGSAGVQASRFVLSNTSKIIAACHLAKPFTSIDHLAPRPNQINGVERVNESLQRNAITPSGAINVIDAAAMNGDLGGLVKENPEVPQACFVLVRHLDLGEGEFKSLVHALGEPNATGSRRAGATL